MALFTNLSSAFANLKSQVFGRWKESDDAIINTYNIKDSDVNSVVLLNFNKISKTKEEIINGIDKIKDFYFSQMILERIIDDAFNPPANSDKFFSVSVEKFDKVDDTLTQILEDFSYKFNIENFIKDVAYDMLLYGEYYLKLDVVDVSEDSHNNGVINIHDDVDIKNILPIFKDGDISYYVVKEKNKLRVANPSEYVSFILPGNRIKLKMDNEIIINDDEKITHIKMGKSVLYPIYGILNELQFFEQMIPIRFMHDSMKTLLVSVQVPSTTKPAEASQIAKAFENMINNTLTFKAAKTPEDFLKELQSKSGNVKVIPNWGEKGEIDAKDLASEINYDNLFEKINDLRKYCLNTIGLPSNIIDEENLKSDVIKENIRYTKKLKTIQSAIAEGLKTLFYIHLVNLGFTNIYKDDIKINYLNTLNIDDIEKLEYIDLMVSMFDNFNSFVDNISSNLEDKGIEVDTEEYINFINKSFKNITGFNIFKYNKDNDDETTDEK